MSQLHNIMGSQTPKGYCGAYTDDVREAVRHINEKRTPGTPFVAIGYSLGANIMVKYLGEGIVVV